MEERLPRSRAQSGFSLVELLVVIAIIGILCALSVPILSKYRDHANIAAARAFGHQILNALTAYTARHSSNTLLTIETCDILAQVVTDNGSNFPTDKKNQFCPVGIDLDDLNYPNRQCACTDLTTGEIHYYNCLIAVPPPACSAWTGRGFPPEIPRPDILLTLPILEAQDEIYLTVSTLTGVDVVAVDDLPTGL